MLAQPFYGEVNGSADCLRHVLSHKSEVEWVIFAIMSFDVFNG